ncbi:hypothetical protein PS922_00870 [Pseudomonas fluorescens]|uniref:Uncharacterized protein n=1 Tax=Pseudomonas fluorescens TaxID=294 RepID=A0A5E7RBH8_PSEFL|nr:hypothetical protein PS922_00870 [Pseudomonas fluorescens]
MRSGLQTQDKRRQKQRLSASHAPCQQCPVMRGNAGYLLGRFMNAGRENFCPLKAAF